MTLAGFVLASNALNLAGLLRLRHRFRLLSGTSVAIGTVAAIIAGPILGAVPAPVIPLVLTLTLLAAAAAFTTKLLGTYLGPVGVPVATLLLLTVGNATSGATTGVDLLPAAARTISPLLPPGSVVRAITDLTYFHGAHAAGPLITLTLWAVIAALLVGLRPRLTRRTAAGAEGPPVRPAVSHPSRYHRRPVQTSRCGSTSRTVPRERTWRGSSMPLTELDAAARRPTPTARPRRRAAAACSPGTNRNGSAP
ncbi:hypothetical protein [Micromonospora sp. DT47]|uniref:hypothetical protein n=1 Tax=Micromonospora sp. DT47 TaxID=3393431 RepID=UPI003CE92BAB